MLAERRKILARIDRGTLTEEEGFLKALELDPEDYLALLLVGRIRQQQGRLEDARRYYWQALRAQPCHYAPYFSLTQLLLVEGDDPQLAGGLLDLAVQKVDYAPDSFREAREMTPDDLDSFSPEALEEVRASAAYRKTVEPQRVTELLRPYRLIHDVQASPAEALDRSLVDRILEYGAACRPLLAGVLRAWAQKVLREGEVFPAKASLALLGEIGDPGDLPAAFEVLHTGVEELTAAALWAVTRTAARRPQETLQAIRKAAQNAEPVTKLCLAFALGKLRNVEGVAGVLQDLLKDLGRVPRGDRDDLFLMVASSLLESQGEQARATLQTLVEQHSSVLRKKTRELALDPPPAGPDAGELAEVSVYDICCEPLDGEAEEGPPHKPGRNEPCWCGSGKKYKKCHLASDEEEEREGTEGLAEQEEPVLAGSDSSSRRLFEGLLTFARDHLSRREMDRAAALFFGASQTGDSVEASTISFLDWLLYDCSPGCFGRPVIEEYLARNRARLSASERETLQQWAQSHYGLYEVQNVQPGTGVELKDLLRGGSMFVHDVSSSKSMLRWDCVLVRVRDNQGRKEFSATGLLVPLSFCPRFREWILADREETGLGWPQYLRANSHRLRQRLLEMAEQQAAPPRMVSAEGDPLVFSKAVYQVLDEPALLEALEHSELIGDREEDEEGGWRFAWFETPPVEDQPCRVLGSLHLRGDLLTLECNSRQRLKRGRKLLKSLAPAALKPRHEEFKSVRSAMREAASSPPPERPKSIPPEVERELLKKHCDDHYRKWPDTPLPFLDGKTPRQALRTPEGRQRVTGLLKMFENGEEHKRREGQPWYDFSGLKASLGIKF